MKILNLENLKAIKEKKKIIRDYIQAGFKKSDIYEINYI